MDMSLSLIREIVKCRESRRAAVHGVTKSWTQMSDWTTLFENIFFLNQNNRHSNKFVGNKFWLKAAQGLPWRSSCRDATLPRQVSLISHYPFPSSLQPLSSVAHSCPTLCDPMDSRPSWSSFSSKEQTSFTFMAAVTICSDFEAQGNKVCHCFHCFPIYLPWSDGSDAMTLVFWMLSFKSAFSHSSFTFIKRLFSSLLSAIRMV